MFLKRLQRVAETIGLACFVLLAVYGLLSTMKGEPAWADWRSADSVPAEVPQVAPMLASSGWGSATVPLVMNYQGELKDAEGNPLTGYYTMTFRIYDDVIAPLTATLWSETHYSVTARGGHFSVLLGNIDPISNTIPVNLFNDPDRFVGVEVEPYDEMVPRNRFGSVPYGFLCQQADHAFALNAPDGSPADALFVDNDGNVGIGTTEPGEKLVVDGTIESTSLVADGIIESTSGGIKFPDGTSQTTAGNTFVFLNNPVDIVSHSNDGNIPWTTIDISSHTGSDTAKLVILRVAISVGATAERTVIANFRATGTASSTVTAHYKTAGSDWTWGGFSGQYIVPLDSMEQFDYEKAISGGDGYLHIWLQGYIK